MHTYSILLIDDQLSAAKDSIAALQNFVSEENISYSSSAAEAIKLIDTKKFSVVFLDIDMPDTNGFSLAAYIEEKHKGLPYVFLTGYANFAAQSYNYEPLDFLTKPIDLVRLQRTFDRLENKVSFPSSGRVALHAKKDYFLIDSENILYISKIMRKILIHCRDGHDYPVYSTMDELEVIFNDYGFFRCHQSYLIPLSNIVQIRTSPFGQAYEAVMVDGSVVPVSRNKYLILKERLEHLGVRFM